MNDPLGSINDQTRFLFLQSEITSLRVAITGLTDKKKKEAEKRLAKYEKEFETLRNKIGK